MKKLFALCLALAMTLSLAACGGDNGDSPKGNSDVETTGNASVESGGSAAGKSYKVGIVKYMDHASLNQIESNLQKQLDAKGQELGVTFDYEDYTFNGQGDGTTLNQIVTQLLDSDVDVIVPIATPAAQTVQAATEDSDLPVVFSAVSDPVTAGLVDSMEEPGTHITGTSDALNTATIMDLMLAADEDLDYVGLLYSKSEDSSTQPIKEAKEYLEAKGIQYIEKTGTTIDEISSAADVLVAEGVDAVFTPTDNTVMKAELAIYEKFAEAKIPHYCGADSFAVNGAFCGYGVDYANLGTATADMVAEILVNGADPASMPVETFDNGIATINTETCEALGLDLEAIKTAYEPLCTQLVETVTSEEIQG